MKHNVMAPNLGESITEVSILKWNKKNGDSVKSGDVLLEIESDKATVEVVAEVNGVLQVIKPAGEKMPIGTLLGIIDDSTSDVLTRMVTPTVTPPPPPPRLIALSSSLTENIHLSPAVYRVIHERGIDPSKIQGTGKNGRITKADATTDPLPPDTIASPIPTISRPGERREPMSRLRARIAERLLQAQKSTASLTTFNEIDMSQVIQIRNEHKDAFKAKYEISLSFMSFFTLATVESLKLFPRVNASIEGEEIIYHDFYDIGIAVGTDRGLVVPVLRNVEKMGVIHIEKAITDLANKARTGKLSIPEMTGGTFTLSNGGVYGSLLSTPILNPPQTAILGMHKIQDRPIAINNQVLIRPMMYIALTYDHRLIDGKEAVSFLVTLKDWLENPKKLGMEF